MQRSAHNNETTRAIAEFAQQGWTLIQAPPVDTDLITLNPDLLATREQDLSAQLESTRLGEAYLTNAAEILFNAREHRTRSAALHAIGHRAQGEGLRILQAVIESPLPEPEKRLALGYIQSSGLGSDTSLWLNQQLHSTQLSDGLKLQIVHKLFLQDVLAHAPSLDMDAANRWIEQLPERWRTELKNSFETAPPHRHAPRQ